MAAIIFYPLMALFVATAGITGCAIWDEKSRENDRRSTDDLTKVLFGDVYKHSYLFTQAHDHSPDTETLLGQEFSVSSYDRGKGILRFASEMGSDEILMNGVHVTDNITTQPQGLFKRHIAGIDGDVTGNWFLVARRSGMVKRDMLLAESMTATFAGLKQAADFIGNVTTSVSHQVKRKRASSEYFDAVVQAILDGAVIKTHGSEAATQALTRVIDAAGNKADVAMAAIMRQGFVAAPEAKEAANSGFDTVFAKKFSACERRQGPCEEDVFADLVL